MLSLFIDIFDKFEPLTNDRFLGCIYGGIIAGIGTAIILKAGASTGGTDLLMGSPSEVDEMQLREDHIKIR